MLMGGGRGRAFPLLVIALFCLIISMASGKKSLDDDILELQTRLRKIEDVVEQRRRGSTLAVQKRGLDDLPPMFDGPPEECLAPREPAVEGNRIPPQNKNSFARQTQHFCHEPDLMIGRTTLHGFSEAARIHDEAVMIQNFKDILDATGWSDAQKERVRELEAMLRKIENMVKGGPYRREALMKTCAKQSLVQHDDVAAVCIIGLSKEVLLQHIPLVACSRVSWARFQFAPAHGHAVHIDCTLPQLQRIKSPPLRYP